ncbi:MAG: cobalamin biosynthesis protein CbiG, partial [Planctomycetes bacterium]|nr:cobalamin biosynthesis protein CbiG [Planctomycetota bacterium]
PYNGLNEYRATERAVRERGVTVQSVWKLNQGVSVGGQTIVGLHYLAALRVWAEEQRKGMMQVWPFETGWTAPRKASVVVAEIFPSVLEIAEDFTELVNDEAQVRTCVRHAKDLDRQGVLAECFHAPPDRNTDHIQTAQREEGWILFA